MESQDERDALLHLGHRSVSWEATKTDSSEPYTRNRLLGVARDWSKEPKKLCSPRVPDDAKTVGHYLQFKNLKIGPHYMFDKQMVKE